MLRARRLRAGVELDDSGALADVMKAFEFVEHLRGQPACVLVEPGALHHDGPRPHVRVEPGLADSAA